MRRESWFVPAQPSRRRTPATLAPARFVMPLIAISRSKKPPKSAAARRALESDGPQASVTRILGNKKRPAGRAGLTPTSGKDVHHQRTSIYDQRGRGLHQAGSCPHTHTPTHQEPKSQGVAGGALDRRGRAAPLEQRPKRWHTLRLAFAGRGGRGLRLPGSRATRPEVLGAHAQGRAGHC